MVGGERGRSQPVCSRHVATPTCFVSVHRTPCQKLSEFPRGGMPSLLDPYPIARQLGAPKARSFASPWQKAKPTRPLPHSTRKELFPNSPRPGRNGTASAIVWSGSRSSPQELPVQERSASTGAGHFVLQWWDKAAKRNLSERIDGDLVAAITRPRYIHERLENFHSSGGGILEKRRTPSCRAVSGRSSPSGRRRGNRSPNRTAVRGRIEALPGVRRTAQH